MMWFVGRSHVVHHIRRFVSFFICARFSLLYHFALPCKGVHNTKIRYNDDMRVEEHPDVQDYKDAVWSFLVEHTQVLPTGKMFVKFHTDGQLNFEKRVRARLRGYHREDWESKNKKQVEQRERWKQEQKEKHEKYEKERRERRRNTVLSQKEIIRAHKRLARSKWFIYKIAYKIKRLWQKGIQ